MCRLGLDQLDYYTHAMLAALLQRGYGWKNSAALFVGCPWSVPEGTNPNHQNPMTIGTPGDPLRSRQGGRARVIDNNLQNDPAVSCYPSVPLLQADQLTSGASWI
jgi:hypothetical protein